MKIIDTYNPKYTKIPSNMVDTVTTDNGNRFINYTVVNSLYHDGNKTAETSIPTVVGSMFGYGAIAISGVAGIGLGMCIMSLIKRKKKS